MSERFHRLFIGALTLVTLGFAGSAAAQDYDAGKNGPQLFASDCNACHKGPAGLAKGRDRGALTSFLKEHYTSKQESAELLAAYLLGAGPGDTRSDKADAAPGGPKAKRKADREAEPKTDQKADQKPGPRPRAEPPAARGDDQNDTHEETAKRTRSDEREAPKGPAETLLSRLHYYGSARGEPKDTMRSANPQARLESYATSGSPADSGTHDNAAPASKRKTSEKKKKRDTDATATERPPHPPRTIPPRQTGNN
ncbi:MAG TPA: hypothetical protein VKX28_25840 [Xanthobacteraceae bacterium]|nr:hypothetical protein [Xanthobacteraceae bacterium]